MANRDRTVRAVRELLWEARSASLATSLAGAGGAPYVSLVTIAPDSAGRPVLLLSELAEHTRNLAADPRAALLLENASRLANPQRGPRLTLIGRVSASDDPAHRRRFLARHPEAAMYAGFADFSCHVMEIERAHYVGGFARAVWLEGAEATVDARAAAALAQIEPGAIEHLNADHADALELYATRLLGRKGRGWHAVGVDPLGLDLMRRGRLARLAFDEPVTGAEALRRTLAALAARARGE